METLSGPPFVHSIFLAMKIHELNSYKLITGGTKKYVVLKKSALK